MVDQRHEDDALAWIARLRRPEMSDEDAAAFARWLESDPGHAAAFDRMTQLWAITGNIGTAALPRTRAGTVHGRSWMALAAAVIVGVVGLLLVSRPDHLHTLEGEQQLAELQDGSRLWLNTDSAVRIDVHPTGTRKVDVLRGEVYFDVHPDERRPFVVEDSDVRITVVGTRFNVRQGPAGTRVDVETGKVTVTAPAATSPEADTETLQAGQALLADAGSLRRLPDSAAKLPVWRDGRIVYDNVTLSDLLQDLDRYIPGSIALADDQLAAMPVSAVLHLDDGPAMLSALTRSLDLAWRELPGGLKLVARR